MKNTTYYFTTNKNETELSNLILDPLFKKIVDYLSEHKEQEVILRQIKADISTENNLELYLDKLIKYGLLERKNRRYYLTFPIYSIEKTIQVPESISIQLKNIVQKNTSQVNFFILGEWLWSLLFEEEQDGYFFGIKSVPASLPLYRKREEGNDTLRFVSVYQENQIPFDLANYFHLLSRRGELPEHFKPLQDILGDVDIHYFIAQVQKVLRSVKRNPSKIRRPNIFEEALITTNDLIRNTEGELFLEATCLEDDKLSEENQHTLDKLETELRLLWETIDDQNQRAFYKMQVYSILFSTCFPKQNQIRYFKQ
ncbi:DUF1803 domain-containing protein [Enterococcus caccae]|uniref:DUF1803 domain-containing protein n=1 Tax=Enterococcus caccae ATCC BAA-1240 TaxID=1158612 RepID=R3WA82_9ENTE|nr:DUF1803 domain-containing protein [Enterococcus caccae]EOL44367.1 hypothetical protein UC7_02411 [Enterococcus caccae ATCC BAA-1240]EOT68517.1 hypothetical protein I580_00900 [Enterococcus caccae ATCC BAA-1240]OJG28270.1 hypothetical protein RU98_GL001518 [Enterococcus caccae]